MRTVIETAEAVRAGELKATEVLDECIERIERHNPGLNAFVHLDYDLARREAERVDQQVANREDPGLLAGVPFGVKDLEDCAGMPTSHGSLLFKGRPPEEHDSVHVARIRAAGAVPVGKTAAPEFGSTCFTHTKAWGTTRNPWNLERTPGGSSGGTSSAVASGLVPFATASDGGGSTRIPAAFSGLVGFKASFGRVPHEKHGGSQTTALGVCTTTVADAARHLDVVAGPHDADRTSLPAPAVRYEEAIEQLDVKRLRATWSVDLGFARPSREVEEICRAAAEQLAEAAGLELVERPIRFTDPVRVWLTASAVDIWMDLERGMWPDRADELMGMVRAGYRSTEDYTLPRWGRLLLRRRQLEQEMAELFADVDVVLTPATAITAFAAEGPLPMEIDGEPLSNPSMVVPYTMLANLCWNPAISVPAGTDSQGLPVGLQVMGRRHADEVVLRLARVFEQARPWPRLAPGYEG